MSSAKAKSNFIIPIDTTGAQSAVIAGPGRFTLLANTTYYFMLGGQRSPWNSVTLTGYTAAMILTSANIEDTDHPQGIVDNFSTVTGEWVKRDSSLAELKSIGTGWTATGAVLAVAGGNLGGARWNINGTGAFRTRLTVVVGGTGGDVLVSEMEKD